MLVTWRCLVESDPLAAAPGPPPPDRPTRRRLLSLLFLQLAPGHVGPVDQADHRTGVAPHRAQQLVIMEQLDISFLVPCTSGDCSNLFFVQASPILGAAWRKHLFFKYVVSVVHKSDRFLAKSVREHGQY